MTASPADPIAAISEGELVLRGRVLPASNATFVGVIGDVEVVYKPIRGERPLWDFPDDSLAGREVAAYLVSAASGWNVVPPTVLREGPHGPGMVQVWQSTDPEQSAVDIVDVDEVPVGMLHVFDGLDARDRPVALVHEDTAALRRMALFDVVVNNADRKGGHVLEMADGHRFGVDHGLTFHVEPKLRTVLWGWAGESIEQSEYEDLAALRQRFEEHLGDELPDHLTDAEITMTRSRLDRLLASRRFPEPSGHGPAIPWPPF